MRQLLRRFLSTARTTLLTAGVVVAGGSAAWVANTVSEAPAAPPAPAPNAEKATRAGKDGVRLPAAVAQRMGLKTAVVERASKPTPLPPFQGRLNIDNNTLKRVRSRFAGEVVELGTTAEPTDNTTSQPAKPKTRPLVEWDRVEEGQLLAVVWSKDLGEKKSQLLDAISKLNTDQKTLERLNDLYKLDATNERAVREAERTVQQDRIAADLAEQTLVSWRLTPAEIQAVKDEAAKLTGPNAKRPDAATWARVEVRATASGWLQEKNVNAGELIGTDADLFKIGDLSRLKVWAHVYEEDLPLFADLPRPIRWTVKLPSRPGATYPGTLEQVAAVIDPNQQTALITGKVDNPTGELKIGQLVTVHIDRPPVAGELVLPTDAVAEDGESSIAFVANGDSTFTRRPVSVLRRSKDVIAVREDAGSVRPGDRVVTAGALLLREALDALPPAK